MIWRKAKYRIKRCIFSAFFKGRGIQNFAIKLQFKTIYYYQNSKVSSSYVHKHCYHALRSYINCCQKKKILYQNSKVSRCIARLHTVHTQCTIMKEGAKKILDTSKNKRKVGKKKLITLGERSYPMALVPTPDKSSRG